MANCLAELAWVKAVQAVETNIVIFSCENPAQRVEELKSKGLLCLAVSDAEIRMVTHLNFSSTDCKEAQNILKSIA